MRDLIDLSKQRPLTDAEKAELQRLFIGLAAQDVLVMDDMDMLDNEPPLAS